MKTRKLRSVLKGKRKSGPRDAKVVAFIIAYLRSAKKGRGNATQAAIEAGYSPKTAHSVGSRLLRKHPKVLAALAELAKEQGVSKAKVMREIGLIAFATLADVLTWEETPAPEGSPPHTPSMWKLALKPGALSHSAVESVEVWTDARGNERLKVTLHPKLGALELYARHYRLLQDGQGSTIESFVVNIHPPVGSEVTGGPSTSAFGPVRGPEKARPVHSLSGAPTVPGG